MTEQDGGNMADKPREFWIEIETESETHLSGHAHNYGAVFNPGAIHVIEYSAYEKLQAENTRLNKILTNEASENDELGAEYTLVCLLKEEVRRLREALEFYAENKHWRMSHRKDINKWVYADTEGSSEIEQDQGKIARKALEKRDE